MLAAYVHTLRESFNRRMALVLIGLAFLTAFLIIHFVPLKQMNDGTSWSAGRILSGPASLVVPAIMAAEVRITGGLWLLLAIFASTPLLVSMMEKGWVELTLTKGVPRWQIMLGAYLGGITLYAATLAVATLPAATWWWIKTGIGVKPLVVAILFQILAFGALMALGALACITRTGVAIPIILCVVVDFVSPVLATRQQGLFTLITSDWGRGLINGLYYILPKNFEVVTTSERYIQFHSVGSWMPFWSTGIFIVVTLGLAMWLLHRKSL
jgi:ABC-type transport system involved in multi-copper enzyme maturation permease subunit